MKRHGAQLARPAELRAAVDEVHLTARRLPQMRGIEAVEIRLHRSTLVEGHGSLHAGDAPDDAAQDVGFGNAGVEGAPAVDYCDDTMELDLRLPVTESSATCAMMPPKARAIAMPRPTLLPGGLSQPDFSAATFSTLSERAILRQQLATKCDRIGGEPRQPTHR